MAQFRFARVALLGHSVIDVLSVIALAWWGFASFALPWPGLAIGLVCQAAAILWWALFLSPRAVIRLDRLGQALTEIVLVTAAGLALVDLGQAGLALAFVLVATALGVAAPRRVFAG